MDFKNYNPGEYYDEFFEMLGKPRPGTQPLIHLIESLGPQDLIHRQKAAESALFKMGITFNVYTEKENLEKIFPFDIIPRIVDAGEWDLIERGIKQRIHAINLFIDDIYNDQRIIKAGVVPKAIIESCPAYRRECIGIHPPKNVWCHISGTDLVRDRDGQIYVLEDNLRCPSGVSYVLGNRYILKQSFPRIFETLPIRPVDDYTNRLIDAMNYLAGDFTQNPTKVILTPGIYNSAYFEHSFLALQMGIELVEGSDLVVSDDFVYMRTTQGFERVDAIYRRIDDDFLDPQVFRRDSLLGVPGLMKSYRAGKVVLVNAPGTGVADDKAIYTYVPKLIKYYLDEEIIIPNVPTFLCEEPDQRQHVIDNMERMVIKEVASSGGYGMLIGPHSTKEERQLFEKKVLANPRNYIGQPVISLSRVPTVIKNHFEGRHVDLRPFAIYGEEKFVLPGGLTRVALKKGSLVVNSSQGGGSKDTWVLLK